MADTCVAVLEMFLHIPKYASANLPMLIFIEIAGSLGVRMVVTVIIASHSPLFNSIPNIDEWQTCSHCAISSPPNHQIITYFGIFPRHLATSVDTPNGTHVHIYKYLAIHYTNTLIIV